MEMVKVFYKPNEYELLLIYEWKTRTRMMTLVSELFKRNNLTF